MLWMWFTILFRDPYRSRDTQHPFIWIRSIDTANLAEHSPHVGAAGDCAAALYASRVINVVIRQLSGEWRATGAEGVSMIQMHCMYRSVSLQCRCFAVERHIWLLLLDAVSPWRKQKPVFGAKIMLESLDARVMCPRISLVFLFTQRVTYIIQ